jgi:hypothetical protein
MEKIKVITGANSKELDLRKQFVETFKNSPIVESEILQNFGLYINRMNLSRMLFIDAIYREIITVHGVIIEFGVRWGQNLALFTNLRGIYEPFNYNRKIIGFDTFEGFPSVDVKDGDLVTTGDYKVTPNYEDTLESILSYHESECPVSHKKKYELIKGDATVTFEAYLIKNPHTIVALAYFDFDIYHPTKVCLELLMNRITKGSVIVFDELNCPEFPGETLAIMETLGLSKYAIKRSPLNPLISYIIID